MKTLIAFLILCSVAWAQEVQLKQGSNQVDVSRTPDGRGVLEVNGMRFVGKQKGLRGWRNATLTRGASGELILSDPDQGQVVVERGPAGKTYVRSKQGNFTIDNQLLLQLNQGQDLLMDQLNGR